MILTIQSDVVFGFCYYDSKHFGFNRPNIGKWLSRVGEQIVLPLTMATLPRGNQKKRKTTSEKNRFSEIDL